MKRLSTLSLLALISLIAAAPANADPQYGFRTPAPGYQGNSFNNGLPNNGFNNGAFNDGRFHDGRFHHGGMNDGGIDQTQARLQDRINRGIASGRLTPREASKLQSRFNEIARLEARMRMTGNRLSERERNALKNQLAILNEKITDDLNDIDRRWTGQHWNQGRRDWH